MTAVRDTEPTAPPRPRAGVWGWVRLAVGCLWLGLFVALPVVGERHASLADLERAIAAGDVDRVEVSGGVGGDVSSDADWAMSWGTATIHWRGDLLNQVTEVEESTAPRFERDLAGGQRPVSDGLPVVGADAVEYLQDLDPGLDVSRTDAGGVGSWSTEIWGFRGPGWMVLGSLAALGGLLVVLMAGPQPWRATRWAWFWFTVFWVPVGQLAFLLLSGPTRGLPPPRRPDDRLTGGWAFLIAFGVGALAGGVLGALGL